MSVIERHQRILNLLGDRDQVRVSEFTQHLDVSEATVRRDLGQLQEQGWVKRTHGGAVLVRKALPEHPMLHRMEVNASEKQRIGKAAAALILDGDTIFVGSGTTALEVARYLRGRSGITVITNALTVMTTLATEQGITLLSTGGILRMSEQSFIGHLTQQALSELRPQKVIMGIRAISPASGLTSDYMPEVTTDRVIIRSAPEVILVADHSKFDQTSTAWLAPATAIHTIVTDDGTHPETLTELRRQGIQVIVV